MKSFDLWLVTFGLRCCALLVLEVGSFLFVIPTLFNLHSDAADAGAAILAIAAVVGGVLGAAALTREWRHLFEEPDSE